MKDQIWYMYVYVMIRFAAEREKEASVTMRRWKQQQSSPLSSECVSPELGFSLASFTSLEAGNRKSDIIIWSRKGEREREREREGERERDRERKRDGGGDDTHCMLTCNKGHYMKIYLPQVQ